MINCFGTQSFIFLLTIIPEIVFFGLEVFTDLGLTMCQKNEDGLDGLIWIKSAGTTCAGTIFKFLIPYK